MTRRALIIGSQTFGLEGTEEDLRGMRAWLETEGFEIDERKGETAHRCGILEGLKQLACNTKSGDAVVIYYSGHGGYRIDPDSRASHPGKVVQPAFQQFLVPTDHDGARAFRGIFRIELTLHLRAITEKSRNVALILDCCYSMAMVRSRSSLGAEPPRCKSVAQPWTGSLQQRLVELREEGLDPEGQHDLRNPDVVLLAAATASGQAYEDRRPNGTYASTFTDALLEHVTRDGVRTMTWDMLQHRIRERVRAIHRSQLPDASGPLHREVFSEQGKPTPGALAVRSLGKDGWALDGGPEVGVAQGDRFVVTLDPLQNGRTIEVSVRTVTYGRSLLSVAREDDARLRAGMLALPLAGRSARPRYRVYGPTVLPHELRNRLEQIVGLEMVGSTGSTDLEPVALEVEHGLYEIHLRDAESGLALRPPWPNDGDGAYDELLEALGHVAHGSRLLALADEERGPYPVAPDQYALEWGTIVDGPLALDATPTFAAGTRVYVCVSCRYAPLFVSILQVGVGRDVTIVTPNEPRGVPLQRGLEIMAGAPEQVPLRGFPLNWPAHVPRDGAPRRMDFVVFLSSEPLSVRAWETFPTDQATRQGSSDTMLGNMRLSILRLSLYLEPPLS